MVNILRGPDGDNCYITNALLWQCVEHNGISPYVVDTYFTRLAHQHIEDGYLLFSFAQCSQYLAAFVAHQPIDVKPALQDIVGTYMLRTNLRALHRYAITNGNARAIRRVRQLFARLNEHSHATPSLSSPYGVKSTIPTLRSRQPAVTHEDIAAVADLLELSNTELRRIAEAERSNLKVPHTVVLRVAVEYFHADQCIPSPKEVAHDVLVTIDLRNNRVGYGDNSRSSTTVSRPAWIRPFAAKLVKQLRRTLPSYMVTGWRNIQQQGRLCILNIPQQPTFAALKNREASGAWGSCAIATVFTSEAICRGLHVWPELGQIAPTVEMDPGHNKYFRLRLMHSIVSGFQDFKFCL